MNERDYRKLRRQIEEDYRRKLDALDVVWAMVNGQAKAGSEAGDESGPSRRGAVEAIVRSVATRMAEPFTPRDVVRQILDSDSPAAANVNRSSVSSALSRLADEDVLTVVEPGKGKRPTIYRVKRPGKREVREVRLEDIPFEIEPVPEPGSELTDDDIPF